MGSPPFDFNTVNEQCLNDWVEPASDLFSFLVLLGLGDVPSDVGRRKRSDHNFVVA